MVAALFVERDGAYYGLENVDPWPIERDARTYDGPHPVVAHPPCDRWHQLSAVITDTIDGCLRRRPLPSWVNIPPPVRARENWLGDA